MCGAWARDMWAVFAGGGARATILLKLLRQIRPTVKSQTAGHHANGTATITFGGCDHGRGLFRSCDDILYHDSVSICACALSTRIGGNKGSQERPPNFPPCTFVLQQNRGHRALPSLANLRVEQCLLRGKRVDVSGIHGAREKPKRAPSAAASPKIYNHR